MMTLRSIIPFPIFAPLPPSLTSTSTSTTTASPSTTEVQFSRWNNANAEEFNRLRRTKKQIEDDLRRHRRYESALNIINTFNSVPTTSTTTNPAPSLIDQNPRFKSIGTPSVPSIPSIPGKKSKYSKPPDNSLNQRPSSKVTTHPAFRKVRIKPLPKSGNLEEEDGSTYQTQTVKVKDGVSYVVPGAPFEYMYSYTETPKAKAVALREPPIVPFEPETMSRPWTGRKPLPPSKKKLPEFDSFIAPPNRKGVKPVQRPGPFLPGAGPKYVWSREEILGDPLTSEEVKDLIIGCRKTKRQLNIGRDGLTHNMLENIHAHWKRRRVCKIKCKGVCTVDMDNVGRQLEEKTGGKIIYQKGGVIFLFRGRNYNYKTRPRYPLMLWKPITPVYPRLVKRVPEGLTLKEATEMRKRGRELVPICKLAKNGVYINLLKNVREAFEACELVRVNCEGLNGSDYRKIGAKLKDLVPCVLVSFEEEHILVWRGRDWKSSLSGPEESGKNNATSTGQGIIVSSSSKDQNMLWLSSENHATISSCSEEVELQRTSSETSSSSPGSTNVETFDISENYRPSSSEDSKSSPVNSLNTNETSIHENEPMSSSSQTENESSTMPEVSGSVMDGIESSNTQESVSSKLATRYLQEVQLLMRQAVESGSALILDNTTLDADIIHEKSVELAQIAPPAPVFMHQFRKVAIQKTKNAETSGGEVVVDEAVPEVEKRGKERKGTKTRKKKGFLRDYGSAAPQGSLGVDELAKLLA